MKFNVTIPDLLRKATRLKNKGYNDYEIAEKLGMKPYEFRYRIRKESKVYLDDLKFAFVEMREAGMTIKEITEETKFGEFQVLRLLRS